MKYLFMWIILVIISSLILALLLFKDIRKLKKNKSKDDFE